MKFILPLLAIALVTTAVRAEIGVISVADAKKLIDGADASKRPVILDTRGGFLQAKLNELEAPK